MDEALLRAKCIQCSIKNLSLEDKEEKSKKFRDKTLIGKLLTTRRFNKSIVASITKGAWPIKRKVNVQAIAENIFKFNFELKEDRDLVFDKRP